MIKLITATCGALLMTANVAVSQEKMALVIANGEYQAIEPLLAARDSAEVMAQSLEGLGFDVTLVRNTNLRYQRHSVAQHLTRLQAAEEGAVGFLYYAGQGVSADGTNYLLPVDISLDDANDLAKAAIDAALLMEAIPDGLGKQAYVVIDCCVANPFDETAGGLAAMTAPYGNHLAYAAPAGSALTAQSTFARDLVNALAQPDTTIVAALEQVSVMQAVSADAPVVETIEAVEASNPELAAWDAIQDGATSTDVVAFLNQYPDGEYAERAKDMFIQILGNERTGVDTEVESGHDEAVETSHAEEPAPDSVIKTETVAGAIAVSFSTPLGHGDAGVIGKTIEELIDGSPLFPPVEGLPESYWKTQECSNCHEWEQANLCTQANTYLSEAGSVNLTKQHPYGGTFKQNLRDWATGGCE